MLCSEFLWLEQASQTCSLMCNHVQTRNHILDLIYASVAVMPFPLMHCNVMYATLPIVHLFCIHYRLLLYISIRSTKTQNKSTKWKSSILTTKPLHFVTTSLVQPLKLLMWVHVLSLLSLSLSLIELMYIPKVIQMLSIPLCSWTSQYVTFVLIMKTLTWFWLVQWLVYQWVTQVSYKIILLTGFL